MVPFNLKLFLRFGSLPWESLFTLLNHQDCTNVFCERRSNDVEIQHAKGLTMAKQEVVRRGSMLYPTSDVSPVYELRGDSRGRYSTIVITWIDLEAEVAFVRYESGRRGVLTLAKIEVCYQHALGPDIMQFARAHGCKSIYELPEPDDVFQ